MQIISDISKWQDIRHQITKDKSIGVVMTMGALHKGHLSLIKESKKNNDITIVTIFINPTQFNSPDDLNNYPKTFDEDVSLLTEENVDLLFAPTIKDIYPDNYNYQIIEKSFSKILCGKSRDGHFEGVLTIVMKLLLLIQPNRAYFGEKDYQQLHLIKQMIKAFFVPVEIIGCAIVRESDNLAFSSRNVHLSAKGREKAGQFANILRFNESIDVIKQNLEDREIDVDYIEEYLGRRFGAVYVDNIRLIDNVKLEEN